MDDEIIQVLMLKQSAIQKPTKFHEPHCRRSFSTGLRSWLMSYRVCVSTGPGGGVGTRGPYHELGRSDAWLGRDLQLGDPSAQTRPSLHGGILRTALYSPGRSRWATWTAQDMQAWVYRAPKEPGSGQCFIYSPSCAFPALTGQGNRLSK